MRRGGKEREKPIDRSLSVRRWSDVRRRRRPLAVAGLPRDFHMSAAIDFARAGVDDVD